MRPSSWVRAKHYFYRAMRVTKNCIFRASLVPVFSFGETDLYDQVDNPEGSLLRKFQERFRKIIGIAPVIFMGRGMFQYSFGLVPQRRKVTTVGS
jgi:2-acylglycerol O-acyltransferase 2